MTWPIKWPDVIKANEAGVTVKALCELYASACMTALTLHRVGGNPVTIMPASRTRVEGYYVGHVPFPDEYPVGMFYPGTVYPSAQYLMESATVDKVEAIDLPGPVGAVTEVRVGGVVLDPLAYRVENGRYLIRLDSGSWPEESGDDFTVTYFNSHPVDEMGAYAAGVMANEWLKLLTRAKDKCRLPSTATNVNRAGITMEIATGMFPEGVTGLPEIDAYLMLFNPFGLRVAPRVYSLDLPEHRQVWHA